MISGFVLLLQALDFRLGIAASLLQIFRGIVEFVLIELELRCGDVELILEIVLLRLRRGRNLAREQLDVFLIVLDGLLCLSLTIGNFFGFGRKLGGRFMNPAQGVVEGEVDFVVPDFLGLMGQRLLFLRASQGCHAVRSL